MKNRVRRTGKQINNRRKAIEKKKSGREKQWMMEDLAERTLRVWRVHLPLETHKLINVIVSFPIRSRGP